MAVRRLSVDIAVFRMNFSVSLIYSLADRISVLVYGRIIASGRAEEIQRNPDVRSAYLGDGDA
mgnify:CR=1 FL=1